MQVETCVCLCFFADENFFHLFFSCSIVKNVWRGVASWLSIGFETQTNCYEFFSKSCSLFKKFFGSDKANMFWNATCWIIWVGKNHALFQDKVFNVEYALFYIKLITWNWSIVGSSFSNSCRQYIRV